jgi:hypothetical protein
MSCGAYQDLWSPFFTLLDRHWPLCPFAVYLGAEEKGWENPNVRILNAEAGGRDQWSRQLIHYLQQLPCPYVLMMLDDFFLRSAVATSDVLHCLEFAQRRQAIQTRLVPRPAPTNRLPGEALIGECAPGLPYRLSTQAAIWNRVGLIELLRPRESIWEFEHNGNRRALALPHGFYSVWRPVLPYQGILAHHVIEKGKWLPHERWIFGRLRIGCDFTRRGTLSWGQTILYHAAQMLGRVLDILPWRTRTKVKSTIKRVLGPLLKKQIARMGGTMS